MMIGTIKRDMFGFTNSNADYDAVVAWRDAAIADGWNHEASYPPTEGEDSACKLGRDGFVVRVISRGMPDSVKWKFEAEVNGWGPDGMAIKLPNPYDWAAIQALVQKCQYCGNAIAGKPFRVGFAGRSCATCGPIQQAMLPKNWAD